EHESRLPEDRAPASVQLHQAVGDEMRRVHAVLAAVLVAAVGLALAFSLGTGRSPKPVADKRRPNPLTPKIVACERSGKLICDHAAYKRDRGEGLFPLSKP